MLAGELGTAPLREVGPPTAPAHTSWVAQPRQERSSAGVWTIVVAAGSGLRFGKPKQFETLGDRRVIDWAVAGAMRNSEGVLVMVAPEHLQAVSRQAQAGTLGASQDATATEMLAITHEDVDFNSTASVGNPSRVLAGTGDAVDPSGEGDRPLRQSPRVDTSAGVSGRAVLRVVAGGVLRSDSVREGLALVPDHARVVLVHDGARPLAGDGVYRRVIDAVRSGAGAVVPAMGVADTVRRRSGGVVDRDGLALVQTPQGFRPEVLRAAHAGGEDATDDAGLAEAAGAEVTFVQGDRRNLKITDPEDMVLAEALVAGAGGGAPVADDLRVGHGYDVHAYTHAPHRCLVLGGVRFEHERGLDGHSDADVVVHACMDALLAAAGLDDIGQMFPDTDPGFGGADSVELLRRVVELLAAAGWAAVNVSCTVVLDSPRIAPVRQEMQRRLGHVVGAPVTVSGRSSEGVGAFGRGEGVAAWAVAMIRRTPTPA